MNKSAIPFRTTQGAVDALSHAHIAHTALADFDGDVVDRRIMVQRTTETPALAGASRGEDAKQCSAREALIYSGGCNRSRKMRPARRNTADMPGHGEDLQRSWALFSGAECAAMN